MISGNVHLIYPMFAMFCLTVVVLIKVFLSRVHAVKTGEVKAGYYKTYSIGTEPEAALKASRHFSNLFEAPVLFYVACILGLILPVQGYTFLVLSWLYVFVRSAHAYIHIGPNKIPHRMFVYGLSWLTLAAMWILILIKALAVSSTL